LGIPGPALVVVIALQLIAGIAIPVGWNARCGAAALGPFWLATAVLFHTNFVSRNELLHFKKALAIARRNSALGSSTPLASQMGGTPKQVREIRPVRHQPAGVDRFAEAAHGRQTRSECSRADA
jgi:hypothetical protein